MRRNGMTRGDVLGGLLGGVTVAVIVVGALAYLLQPGERPQFAFTSGLPEDFKAKAEVAYAAFPEPFKAGADQDNERKNARLWGPTLRLNPGPQQIGDCTSWGASHAIHSRIWFATGRKAVPEPFPPQLYYLARHNNGRAAIPCSSDGGYPSYLIANLADSGWCTYEEASIPYSGQVAKAWGCKGPPRDVVAEAAARRDVSAYPIRSVEEWRDAICNGYPCTVAIPWRPGKASKESGRWCLAFNGRNLGGHQISSVGYDGSSGKPYWFLMNSHGADWPPGCKPLQGEPEGGVWVNEQWAKWIVDNGELWAISDVPGFDSQEIDWSAFDTVSTPIPRQ